jgi:hypothetical protein
MDREEAGDVATPGSAGSPSDMTAPISASTAVLALAAVPDAGILRPSGPFDGLEEILIGGHFMGVSL